MAGHASNAKRVGTICIRCRQTFRGRCTTCFNPKPDERDLKSSFLHIWLLAAVFIGGLLGWALGHK